jgi:deoxyribonuclease V
VLLIIHRGAYNLYVEILRLHDWRVTTSRAREIQEELAGQVSRRGRIENPHLVGGLDISVNRFAKTGTAAAVVLSFPALELLETSVVTGPLEFPYVPGLLSFREAPLTLAACEKLALTPDVFLVDGQGIAHPRRMGIASHLGLCLGVPTIGCAKSRLIGEHEEPGQAAGSYADLVDGGEVIGAVLRTRTGIRPVYVSIGSGIDLASAVRLVLDCCHGHRLPEPARLAHLAAGGNLKNAKLAIG